MLHGDGEETEGRPVHSLGEVSNEEGDEEEELFDQILLLVQHKDLPSRTQRDTKPHIP